MYDRRQALPVRPPKVTEEETGANQVRRHGRRGGETCTRQLSRSILWPCPNNIYLRLPTDLSLVTKIGRFFH